jgi:hypothetical protein
MVENKILRCLDDFNGSYDKWHYVERVYKTIDILSQVIDMSKITKYHLKKNRNLLDQYI